MTTPAATVRRFTHTGKVHLGTSLLIALWAVLVIHLGRAPVSAITALLCALAIAWRVRRTAFEIAHPARIPDGTCPMCLTDSPHCPHSISSDALLSPIWLHGCPTCEAPPGEPCGLESRDRNASP